MWQSETTAVDGGRRHRLREDEAPLTFRRFFRLLERDEEFRDWYTALLASFPAEAFYWELPALTRARLDSPAEFVLIAAPGLAGMPPEPGPFAAHFVSTREDVTVFPNLGGDALLVVPCPVGPAAAYPQLADFLRKAPRDQVQALWRRAASTLMERIGDDPVWLSTAGGGVAWLHVRLDSRPKYYSHAPYTTVTPA